MADVAVGGASPRGRSAGQEGRVRRCRGQVVDRLPGRWHPGVGRRGSRTRRGATSMTTSLQIECEVHFQARGRGRKEMRVGPEAVVAAPGRVPRVARWLALAHRLERLLRAGAAQDYADLAQLGHVTRARVSQIMSLLQLAPDIQEAILFLPRVERGRDPVVLRDVLPIAASLDWKRQRRKWEQLGRK